MCQEISSLIDIDLWLSKLTVGAAVCHSHVVLARGTIMQRRVQKGRIFCMLQLLSHHQAQAQAQAQSQSQAQTSSAQLIQLVIKHGNDGDHTSDQSDSSTQLQHITAHFRVGAVVRINGYPASDREGSLSVYVSGASLLKCSTHPSAILKLLQDGKSGYFTRAEVIDALVLPNGLKSEGDELMTHYDQSLTTQDSKMLNQTISQYSRRMLGKGIKRARQRAPHVSKNDMDALNEAEEMHAHCLWPLDDVPTSLELCKNMVTPQPHLPGGAEDVLSARGSLTRKEYWQQRKSPQIRWMAERVGVMVKNGVRHVVDIGGGRGDLALLIAQSHPEVSVTMVDVNKESLSQAESEARARRLDDSRISFRCESVSALWNLEETETTQTDDCPKLSPLPAVDLVVALHACGGLSDMALFFAAVHQSQFLVCPCCYVKQPMNLGAMLSEGTIPAPPPSSSSSSSLSSSSSSQSVVPLSTSMWVSKTNPLPPAAVTLGGSFLHSLPHRCTLLRLAESNERSLAVRASHLINSERLNAMQRWKCSYNSKMNMFLCCFPAEYSLRNIVLCGEQSFSSEQ